jgi:DinB superfamily
MSERLRRLLDEEERWWHTFHALIDDVPPERLADPRIPPDGWSTKDVMFHVGAWLADAGRTIEQIRFGTFTGEEPDSEELNREWFSLSRSLDLRTCRAELESSRVRCRAELATLSSVTPQAQEWFEEAGALHYRAHAKDLLDWIVPGRRGDG